MFCFVLTYFWYSIFLSLHTWIEFPPYFFTKIPLRYDDDGDDWGNSRKSYGRDRDHEDRDRDHEDRDRYDRRDRNGWDDDRFVFI